jgi:hypothetical protein
MWTALGKLADLVEIMWIRQNVRASEGYDSNSTHDSAVVLDESQDFLGETPMPEAEQDDSTASASPDASINDNDEYHSQLDSDSDSDSDRKP